MTEHTGLWMYAVAAELPQGPLDCPSGIDDGRVDVVNHNGIAAVVSGVDIEQYNEEALPKRLEDFDWLAATAKHHHAVIEAVNVVSTIIPMRLATVYLGTDSVTRLLTERYDVFHRALSSVAGHTEWGVKAYAAPQTSPRDAKGSESGTDYLRRRKAELDNSDSVRKEVWDAAQRIFGELGLLASAQRQHRPQDAKLSGREDVMLVNGSFLVDDTEQDKFRQVLADLSAAHPELEVQLSGPWPPYSFAGLAVES